MASLGQTAAQAPQPVQRLRSASQPIAGSRNLQTGSTNSNGGRTKRRGPQSNAGNDAGRNTRLVHLELLDRKSVV